MKTRTAFPRADAPFVLLFLAVWLAGSSSSRVPGPAAPAEGREGMVSSAHPLATEAGLEILKKGGNAFDAAVAVAAALNVVEPMMSGLGGYGTILIYDAQKREIRFLNSGGRIPAAVDSDAFRPPTEGYLENRRGAKAVSTTGNVHAWEALSAAYGALSWAELFEPAVELAEKGFVLDENLADSIAFAFDAFPAAARLIYGRGGRPLRGGERLVQKDLAVSLRLVAVEGAEAFYRGRIGRAIDDEMRRTGGFLALGDLSRDKAEWYAPVRIHYRGFEVYTASPPATAFPSLIRLGLMSRVDAKAMGHNSLKTLHFYAEVTKHAFFCRLRYAGDPEVSPPPLERLLSPDYWEETAARIDRSRASVFEYPRPGGDGDAPAHTTHFVVADSQGNIVSATQTLGNLFGSRIMPQGTGVWLNNSLAYCTFEPAGNPMDAHAGRHKLSGDCPTIILREGKPWAALGTPGGHTIGQTVPQMVMNLVDFGMDIRDALAAPRVSFIEPDVLAVEKGMGPGVRKGLKRLGHKVRVVRALGNAHGLTVEYDAGGRTALFRGASDPRGNGLAKGY